MDPSASAGVRQLDLKRAEIAELCRQFHVRELSLFGSALTPDFQASSDWDLLVEFEPDRPPGFLRYAALQRQLSEVLGRPVDLVPKSGLKPQVRESILRQARVLYAA